MRCPKCNTALPMSANFCIKCGEPLKPTARHRTRKLVCDSCGGEMTVEEDRPILICPYCGAKELLPESDKVTVQRIKSKTYKEVEKGKQDVELERLRYENEKLRHEIEKEKRDEDKEIIDNFKNGKFSKVIFFFAICCIVFAATGFNDGHVRSCIVGVIQAVLFTVSWCIGIGIIKTKLYYLYVILAIIGFGLIPVFATIN